MALTLEQALGRPIEDLEDIVMAQAMFGYIKHQDITHDEAREKAEEDINQMSNTEFLSALSIAIKEMQGRNLLV